MNEPTTELGQLTLPIRVRSYSVWTGSSYYDITGRSGESYIAQDEFGASVPCFLGHGSKLRLSDGVWEQAPFAINTRSQWRDLYLRSVANRF